MTSVDETPGLLSPSEASSALRDQWRGLSRAATFVALLTSPALFAWFYRENDWGLIWSLLLTLGAVIVFRGLIDIGFRRLLPWPSLFGTDDAQLREEDVVNRRRAWFWRSFVRWAVILGGLGALLWWAGVWDALSQQWGLLIIFPFYFIFNFLILLGPMLAMGVSQIRGFEPGDADWGVRLDDVRGQAEAKEEVRKIVTLWQSGEEFVKAGGKRERGILFLGAPGTGKTMLAKAIATGFNSPFVTIPGSGFSQMFMASTPSSFAGSRARPRRWPGNGAARASSSSTRSTPSACAARPSAEGRPSPRPKRRPRAFTTIASTARSERSTRAAT